MPKPTVRQSPAGRVLVRAICLVLTLSTTASADELPWRTLQNAAASEFGPGEPSISRLSRGLVELDGGEVRPAGPALLFESLPRLQWDRAVFPRNSVAELGDYDLDKWFPRATGDLDGADLMLVANPLGSLFGISAGRVRGEYADDFDSNRRIGGQLMLFGRNWLGIETEWNHREFDLPAGRDNEFWTGDANLMVRLPQVRMLNMRAGAGASWLHDLGATKVGYNLTYSADVFVKRPWLLSGEVDWGRLAGRDLFHGRLTLGLVFGCFEAYTGYDYFDLGNMELDGLVGGAGLYF